MIVIGIDQSLNNTGICILDGDKVLKFFLITSKMTRKMKSIENPKLDIIEYDKTTDNIKNILEIRDKIKYIFNLYKPSEIHVESPALRACGNIVDLSGLFYIICGLAYDMNINIKTIQPTKLKKWATGNGCAEKDVMTDAFLRLNPDMKLDIKIDDLADSYFLAKYDVHEVS